MNKTDLKKLEWSREWKARNKKRVREYRKKYYQKNKAKEAKLRNEWLLKNTGKKSEYDTRYREKHREYLSKRRKSKKVRQMSNKRAKEIYWKSERKRVELILRAIIVQAVRKVKTSERSRAKDLLGCSVSDFKRYLESKFEGGMSWGRFSEIHIDHIKPCAAFDLLDENQQKECFHYTNLQPLWASDNIKKRWGQDRSYQKGEKQCQ